MIYKDYFIHSGFEDVWTVLQSYYHEPDSTRQLYKRLFYTIRNLPIDAEHASSSLRIEFDFDNMIHIAGAPDPIEWLTGREVVFDEESMKEHYRNDGKMPQMPAMAEFAAHLLYWSTLYDFRTQARHRKDFEKFMDSCIDGTRDYSPEDPGISLSRKRKKSYYWKSTLAEDTAIDWSYILKILRKRIEYHIGYHRFTDRFVNSRHYVSRMELCSRLLELARRFVGPVFNYYHLKSIEASDYSREYDLSELRRAKAYKILWKFLDHNLTYWWD